MIRYTWLIAALMMTAVTPTDAASSTRVVIGYAAMSPRVAPLWAAQERGFFSRNGIDAELVFLRNAPMLVAAMTSGDLQIGFTGGTAVLGAAAGGLDLKILSILTNRVTLDLVARPGIKTAADLRGKRFGTAAIGGTLWMSAVLGLERVGIDVSRDDIRFLALGDAALLAQALEEGRIDGAALDIVFSRRLQEKGFPVLAEFGKMNIPMAGLGIVARNQFMQKSPTVVENFLRSVLEGIAFVLAPQNKTATLAILQKHLRVTQIEAEEGFKDMSLGSDRKPYPSIEGLRNVQRLMKARNPKLENAKVEDLVDERILRKLDESGFIDRLYAAQGAK